MYYYLNKYQLELFTDGDFSGLYVKLANNIEVSVLKEVYAEQYAYGVVGFVELDAKVVETQKIVAIKNKMNS